jgi:hypothetical protein
MTLVECLMQRDNLSRVKAEEVVQEARIRVVDGEDPETVLWEEFGVEPDYLFDILTFD